MLSVSPNPPPVLGIAGEPENDSIAGSKKLRRLRRRRKKKKKVTPEQIFASKFVHSWAFGSPEQPDDGRVVFELHSHSKFSDGFLSPAVLVERAHRNGVKVLALTDHDTMAGIPEAVATAHKFNMRIIPGVEISAMLSSRDDSGVEEPLHILAYYGSCGPLCEELEEVLANIQEGRYIRAQEMLVKLDKLKMPLMWEDVLTISGKGVAPGRVHVASAMVEAGYVENLKQAFSRYLYDGGPAYAKGNEPSAEYVVQLICRSGGIATLAHPWSLKNPASVIQCLKTAGLHAVEVYRSNGKLSGFCDLADTYDLLKLGGSDFHGREADVESKLGSVYIPVLDVFRFLKLAQNIWCGATSNISRRFIKETSCANMKKNAGFEKLDCPSGCTSICCCKDSFDLCILSSWITNEGRQNAEREIVRLELSDTVIR